MKTPAPNAIRFAPARAKYQKIGAWAWIFVILLYFPVAILMDELRPSDLIIGGFFLIIAGIQIYAYFNTYYELTDTHLHYRAGFSKGSIPVSSIFKVEKTSSAVGSLKTAPLSKRGLLLHYGHYEDIFVTPKDREGFLKELLRTNPAIVVKQDPEEKEKKAA